MTIDEAETLRSLIDAIIAGDNSAYCPTYDMLLENGFNAAAIHFREGVYCKTPTECSIVTAIDILDRHMIRFCLEQHELHFKGCNRLLAFSKNGDKVGSVINRRSRRCLLKSCSHYCMSVRWSDGKLTYPCNLVNRELCPGSVIISPSLVHRIPELCGNASVSLKQLESRSAHYNPERTG